MNHKNDNGEWVQSTLQDKCSSSSFWRKRNGVLGRDCQFQLNFSPVDISHTPNISVITGAVQQMWHWTILVERNWAKFTVTHNIILHYWSDLFTAFTQMSFGLLWKYQHSPVILWSDAQCLEDGRCECLSSKKIDQRGKWTERSHWEIQFQSFSLCCFSKQRRLTSSQCCLMRCQVLLFMFLLLVHLSYRRAHPSNTLWIFYFMRGSLFGFIIECLAFMKRGLQLHNSHHRHWHAQKINWMITSQAAASYCLMSTVCGRPGGA